MSGRTHSDDTKIIMLDAKKGENHHMFGQNHSEETRAKSRLLLRVILMEDPLNK
jgi:hypothetical protein